MFVSDESINQINQVVVERELFLCVFTSQRLFSLMRSQMSTRSGSSFSLYGISRVPFLSRFRRSPYLHADSHARTHARTHAREKRGSVSTSAPLTSCHLFPSKDFFASTGSAAAPSLVCSLLLPLRRRV